MSNPEESAFAQRLEKYDKEQALLEKYEILDIKEAKSLDQQEKEQDLLKKHNVI